MRREDWIAFVRWLPGRDPGDREHRRLVRGVVLYGIVLIVVGLLVGPCCVSVVR